MSQMVQAIEDTHSIRKAPPGTVMSQLAWVLINTLGYFGLVVAVRFSQRTLFLSLHPNIFSNPRGPLAARNHYRTPAIPWRAN